MTTCDACHRQVMLGGKPYRKVSRQTWDLQTRLQDMHSRDVVVQVLSPMPELLSYWLEPEDGLSMSQFLNATIAEMVSADPSHFSGLGSAPMQDIGLAVDELSRIRKLGLAGVEIGSNVNGVPVGDPKFLPFFEAAASLGLAVFVHPLRPSGMDRLSSPLYEQVLAFPGEIGLAAASMITGGILRAVPGLRVAMSHGAGSLQVLVPRMQQAFEKRPELQDLLVEPPLEAARRMYYDDLLYDRLAIESLVRMAGSTQVMVGTDYPFAMMDQDPNGRVGSLELDDMTKAALRRGNALRWLGQAAVNETDIARDATQP